MPRCLIACTSARLRCCCRWLLRLFAERPAKSASTIRADGSSTVFPITEAVAEEFRNEQPDVRAVIGFSGTGGGFKKLAAGEIDICDASRTIKDEERARVRSERRRVRGTRDRVRRLVGRRESGRTIGATA